MKLILSFLLLLSLNSYSQQQIKIDDVSKHIGDSVKIEAKIYGGKYLENSKGSPTFLNVGAKYPDALLTLVIWNDVRLKFSHQPIEQFFNNKNVMITGVIKEYKGKPEIIIYNQNQMDEVAKIDVRQ